MSDTVKKDYSSRKKKKYLHELSFGDLIETEIDYRTLGGETIKYKDLFVIVGFKSYHEPRMLAKTYQLLMSGKLERGPFLRNFLIEYQDESQKLKDLGIKFIK